MGRVYLLSPTASYPDIPNFNTAMGTGITPTDEQRLTVADYTWNNANSLTYYEGPSDYNSSNVRLTFFISGSANTAYAFYNIHYEGSLVIFPFLRALYPNTRYMVANAQRDGLSYMAYGGFDVVTPVAPYYQDSAEALKGTSISNVTIEPFSTREEAVAAITPYLWNGQTEYPITYRSTNSQHSGPDEAAVGDTVTVNYTFPDGYGIVNSSDIYVTNNGVLIPSTYSNGTLTFTMPDPS